MRGGRSLGQQTPLEQYRGYLLGWRRNSPSTFSRYVHDLRFLEDVTGKNFLSDLSVRLNHQDVVNAIVANPQLAPESASLVIKAAKSWEKAGEFLGWWAANGILHISYPKPSRVPKPSLTMKQVGVLLDSCKTAREWRLVGFGLFAGMRVGDAERIREQNWLDDRIRYQAKKTKNPVEVPTHPELQGLRRVILNDSPEGGVLKMVAVRLRDRVGFYFSPNTLRATFTQRLLDLEVPLFVVKDLRGDVQRDVVFQHYATVPMPLKMEAISTLAY